MGAAAGVGAAGVGAGAAAAAAGVAGVGAGAAEAPLPELRKTAFGVPGARVNRKKRQVLLQMAQLCIDNKKIEPYEGLTLMTDYVNASLARKILQNRQD